MEKLKIYEKNYNSFGNIFFDRITKLYFINLQETGLEVYINVFPFLDFVFHYNHGNSFGLFQLEPNSISYNIMTGFILIINIIIFLMVFEKINNLNVIKKILNFLSIPNIWRKNLHSYTFALILGGGLGNLYDRIVYYGVVDFINLHYGDFNWPAFNIADSFITLGIIGLLLAEIFKKDKVSNNV